MDLNSLVGTLMSSDSVQNIAGTVNADPNAVKKVISAALPSLLSGAKEQSEDASTGFEDAILSHGQKDTADLSSFLKNVDLDDGKKIIAHLLGSKTDDTLDEISRAAGTTTKSTSGILSAAAPLLMSLLGKQASSNQSSGLGSLASSLFSGLDIGSLLTGILTDKKDEEKEEEKPAAKGSGLFGLLGKLFKKK